MADTNRIHNLLQTSPAGGCGCKLPLVQLRGYLDGLGSLLGVGGGAHDHVLIDSTDRDDAALYEISPGLLLAITTDFGTPVSNDAITWGRIAAQNALSDIYAMGARPLLALSVMGVPESFDVDFMTELTSGALEPLHEAGAALVGGHTVRSAVPLFGLSVIGQVPAHQAILLRNARPGQQLVVTKPLGTGIVLAAARAGVAPSHLVDSGERVMLLSNRAASETAVKCGIVAGTDVSGFGLIGHLQNMMSASACSARLDLEEVPVIPGVLEILTEHAVVPNSAEGNFFAMDGLVDWQDAPFDWRLILSDPQTSGGLLLAVDPAVTPMFLAECAALGLLVKVIGTVGSDKPGTVSIGPPRHIDS